MNVSWAASIFYLVSVLWLIIGVFLYKKTDKKQAGITWIVVILILLNCYHCLTAAFIDLVHIPVNIVTAGILDVLAGCFFWWQIYKKKVVQKYIFAWIDLVFTITVIVILAIFTKIHYGGIALNINYLTIDPSNHYRAAMDVLNGQSITSMFYETIWNGYFIELLGPLKSMDYYSQFFVLSEVINLGLSGFIFYGIVRRHVKDQYSAIVGYVLAIMYMIGYPMCSAYYGFVYLGMGVTVIGLLIILTDMYLKEEVNKRLNVGLLMLGCLAIFECYVMFMPIVFFAIISCIFVKKWQQKQLVSKDTVITCLAVFLIPCIIGFVYTYAGVFSEGVTVSNAIVNEGACYRDLFSNFVFYAPLAIIGYIILCRRKENNIMLFLTPYTIIFVLGLFLKTVTGKASTYYYYKMYFMLWLIAFVLMFYGALYAEKQTRQLIVAQFAIWCLLIGMYIGKVEERIKIHSDLMVADSKAGGYNDIIRFNCEVLYMAGYSAEKLDLYHYVYEKLVKADVFAPMAGYWEDDLWYQAITNQRYYGWGQSDPDHTDYFNHLNESDATYITVLKDSQIYADEQNYFDALERVYENNIGFVAVLK